MPVNNSSLIDNKTMLALNDLTTYMSATYNIDIYNFVKTGKRKTIFSASSSVGAIVIHLYSQLTTITFTRLLRHVKDVFHFRHSHPIFDRIQNDLNNRIIPLNACKIEHYPVGSKSFSGFFDSLNISFTLKILKNKRYKNNFKVILKNKAGYSSLLTNQVILQQGYNLCIELNYKKDGFDYSFNDYREEIHKSWDIPVKSRNVDYRKLGELFEMVNI